MEAMIGSNIGVFIAITLVIMGFATFMTGQALASTWRPMWQVFPYGVMLGFADRFLTWALFDGILFSLVPYLISTAILLVICLGAFRLTQARKMVGQYPWVYERDGLFGWRERRG